MAIRTIVELTWWEIVQSQIWEGRAIDERTNGSDGICGWNGVCGGQEWRGLGCSWVGWGWVTRWRSCRAPAGIVDTVVDMEFCQFFLVIITYLVEFTYKITDRHLSLAFFSFEFFSKCLQHLLKVKHLKWSAYKTKNTYKAVILFNLFCIESSVMGNGCYLIYILFILQ